MVKNIEKNGLEAFAPLLTANHMEQLESGEIFCLGALKEDGDAYIPVGALVFSVEEGFVDGTEPSTMIVLQWLYVAEEYRMQGYANELMEALSDVLEDSPADGIICDVPFDSEYDLVEAFLTSWDFAFEVVSSNEMIVTKEDCKRQGENQDISIDLNILKAYEEPKGMVHIRDLSDEEFEKSVKRAKEDDKTGVLGRISENKEDYAGDMSCAMTDGKEITAIALFERLAECDLHLVVFMTFKPDGAKDLLRILRYVSLYYYLNYPENAKIHLTLGTQKGMNLASKLFPDMDPIQVRRGYFS